MRAFEGLFPPLPTLTLEISSGPMAFNLDHLPSESFPVDISGWDLPAELLTHVPPVIPVEYAIIISDLTCLNQTLALLSQTAPPAAVPISVNTNSTLPGAQGKGLEVILDSFFSFTHTFQFSRKLS